MRLPELDLALPIGSGLSPRDLVALAVSAEQAGFQAVTVGEIASTEAFSLLGALALATSRVRLETGIVTVLTRSPALLAMAAATLSDLSEGRFVLGLGLGSPLVAGWHGAHFPHTPVTDAARVIEQVRLACGGGRLDSSPGRFQLSGIAHPPELRIHLAAMNRGMVRLAGRLADGVILNFCDPAQVGLLGGHARSAHSAAGRGSPRFRVFTTVWATASLDRDVSRRQLKLEVAPYLAVPTYRSAAVAIAGEAAVDEAAEVWRSRGRRAASSYVPDAIVDALLLQGSDDTILEQLIRLAAAGGDGVRIVPLSSGADPTPARQLVERLGRLCS